MMIQYAQTSPPTTKEEARARVLLRWGLTLPEMNEAMRPGNCTATATMIRGEVSQLCRQHGIQ